MVNQHMDGETFRATEQHECSAATMLAELARWARALTPMRSATDTVS